MEPSKNDFVVSPRASGECWPSRSPEARGEMKGSWKGMGDSHKGQSPAPSARKKGSRLLLPARIDRTVN